MAMASLLTPPLLAARGLGAVRTSSSFPAAAQPPLCWRSRVVSLFGFKRKKQSQAVDIVLAGDPVLHEPAMEVSPAEVGGQAVQKVIDQMIDTMRRAPGVGLAAPQIGVPLQIVVLEDTAEYISYAPAEEVRAQDRRPFELLVVINPKLQALSSKSARFFEGCLSVPDYRALVERHLEVQVSALDRHGEQLEFKASGWKARILQHECDHLAGTLYVDKLVPRTFRTVENMRLPLPRGCPELGPA